MNVIEIEAALSVCERMIDKLQRELYSNNAMLGAMNSAYEALTENDKIIYKAKVQQLGYLITYRIELLNYAETTLNGGTPGTEPELEIAKYTLPGGTEQDFDFSL